MITRADYLRQLGMIPSRGDELVLELEPPGIRPQLRHYQMAAERTGLANLAGPIHIDDLQKLKLETSRLAEVIASHDQFSQHR